MRMTKRQKKSGKCCIFPLITEAVELVNSLDMIAPMWKQVCNDRCGQVFSAGFIQLTIQIFMNTFMTTN